MSTGNKSRIRFFRLALVGIIGGIIFIEIAFSWIYVESLISPACLQPTKLENYPAPQVESLQTADGAELEVWVYPSKNGAAVIALGGLGGSLGVNHPPIEFLLDAGYGVVQIGSRTCGRAEKAVTLGYQEAFEANEILQYIMLKNNFNARYVGVYGFSMGGVASIRAAAANPEILAVVAEGGYANLGEDLVDRGAPLVEKVIQYTVAGIFWLRTGVNPWESSPIDDIQKISPRPVLLIYGEHEMENARAQAQYDAAREPKELWIVAGGRHGTNHMISPEEYQKKVLNFFNLALLGIK